MIKIKINLEDFQLSGLGLIVEKDREYLNDNFKIASPGVEFHEVINEIDNKRVGWIVIGKLEIIADFTVHTEEGMNGKSVDDTIEFSFIFDPKNFLNEFTMGELEKVNTDVSQKLCDKYFNSINQRFKGNIHIDDVNEENALIIISIKSEYVFIQTEENSIRIADSEILILNKLKDSLSIIASKEGITVIESGKKKIEIGKNSNIVIDGKEINPKKIIENISESLKKSFKI